VNRNWTRRRW